jgi:hypothetical protein
LIVNVSPAIVSVPDRDPPLCFAALNETFPLPLPLEPPVTLIQSALLAAVHAQPAAAVTPTVPEPPSPGRLVLVAESAYEQPPGWLTVKVCPAAVIVPVLAGPAFAAALNCTVPLPAPVAPAEIVSQAASAVADHAQPLAVWTSKDPDPPPAGTDAFADVMANVQPCPWLTVNVRPAIVTVADRLGPVVPLTVS